MPINVICTETNRCDLTIKITLQKSDIAIAKNLFPNFVDFFTIKKKKNFQEMHMILEFLFKTANF